MVRPVRIVNETHAIAAQGKAHEHASHSSGWQRDQNAEKAEQGAEAEQGEDDPDRVEMNPGADELWLQEVAADEMAHNEDRRDDDDLRPGAELDHTQADRQQQA